MYELLISAISNLFRLLLIRKLMMLFFYPKIERRKLELVFFSLFYFSTLFLFLIFKTPIINLASNVIGLFLITTLYSSSTKKKVFAVITIYGLNMICDTIAGFAISNYKINSNNNPSFQIFTVLLLLICELCIEKLVDKKNKTEFSAKYWWVLFIIPFSSVILLFFTLYCDLQNRFFVVMQSILILIINIVVFYLYNALIDNYIQLIEKENLKKQVSIYSNQLEIIMQTQDKIRSLHHDMKHHTLEIYSMVKQNKKTELMEYIQQMITFMTNPEEHVYSGNRDIDGVLNYLLHKGKKVLNDVNVKICIPENMNFPTFDLNVIIGNLLENAIESSQKSTEKVLNISITLEKRILFIKISNSYNGIINTKKGKLISTKKNPASHGIGLNNVKKIVESYNGIMDISYTDNFFEVELMLYLNINFNICS